MFCIACGTPLPANAQFCNRCGSAQPPNIPVVSPAAVPELCEIRLVQTDARTLFHCPRGVFCAVLVDRPHAKAVCTSRKLRLQDTDSGGILPDITEKEQQSILKAMTGHLAKQGWQPIGQVGPWPWQHRFTRRKPSGG